MSSWVPQQQEVKLGYVTRGEIERLGAGGGEPQTIQVSPASKSSLYIDTSTIRDPDIDKTNLQISTILQGGATAKYPLPMVSNPSKIAIAQMGYFATTPNVNLRNNVISFLSSNTGATVWTVTVPEGFYLTPTTLKDAVVLALNTLSIPTGLVFSSVLRADGVSATLDSAGGSYQILDTCIAVTRGKTLWNLPDLQSLGISKVIGPMGGQYSPCIDICSTAMTLYARRYCHANTSYTPNSIVARIYPFSGATGNDFHWPQGSTGLDFGTSEKWNWFYFDPTATITSLDFQWLDIYGDPYYVPPALGGQKQSSFDWSMQLVSE